MNLGFSEWLFQGFTVALGDCGQGRFRNREDFSQAGIIALGVGFISLPIIAISRTFSTPKRA